MNSVLFLVYFRCVSGLSILGCPFGFRQRLLIKKKQTNKKTTELLTLQGISITLQCPSLLTEKSEDTKGVTRRQYNGQRTIGQTHQIEN